MKKSVFSRADILLPKSCIPLELWSVIACDQFSSEPEYWERIKLAVGNTPSTLNMIIPEAYLEKIDEENEIDKISKCMEEYINDDIFREIKDSFIYIERTLSNNDVRRGLVGVVDLEEYEFSNNPDIPNSAAILASEGTVLDRLPPRIRVRKAATLELPHIMTFIADVENTVIEPLTDKVSKLPLLYDFELLEGGGHVKGYEVSGDCAKNVEKALETLYNKNRLMNPPNCLMIMGDGNHSLAAAKTYWNELKQNLSETEKNSHPARYALLEVNNLYDSAIQFEAIHRVVFNVDSNKLINALIESIPSGNDYKIQIVTSAGSKDIDVSADSVGDAIAIVQAFLDEYICIAGGSIDYIHGDDTVRKLAQENNCTGILLPTVEKSEFFNTVACSGVFPRKSFSVGHARDKRYYIECRRII